MIVKVCRYILIIQTTRSACDNSQVCMCTTYLRMYYLFTTGKYICIAIPIQFFNSTDFHLFYFTPAYTEGRALNLRNLNKFLIIPTTNSKLLITMSIVSTRCKLHIAYILNSCNQPMNT